MSRKADKHMRRWRVRSTNPKPDKEERRAAKAFEADLTKYMDRLMPEVPVPAILLATSVYFVGPDGMREVTPNEIKHLSDNLHIVVVPEGDMLKQPSETDWQAGVLKILGAKE